ncbi:MAG TPA: carboxypeptidase regulatory-like domain-containing protein [Vicinamibacterales bacterium]|jgi:hypothetical protein|nr:carboxypeptidase regulatory-like domain-containing protein [Vicinamibacterales bacterium]
MNLRRFIFSLGLLLLGCCGAYAQQSASSGIIGQVTDASKGSVPGATVTVVNVATNAQREAATDTEGRFSIQNLAPASYDIRVELSGFRTVELKNFELRQGEIARPAITLELATIAETVTVTTQAPLLQTQSASVSQTITQRQIEQLPVVGRNLLSLAALTPGVTPQSFTRGTQFGAANSSRNQYVTVEGGRDSSTNYAVDGVYVRSLRFNNISLNPPLDVVQEVTVLRNAFSTEYGQGQAVVSIITKSGANTPTGSVYEFLRNDKLTAKNYFDTTKPPYKRNQYGATAGGAVTRNRFFFFAGYEGLRTTQGRTFFASVPDPTQLTGNFAALATPIVNPMTGQPFPGNVIPASAFSKFATTLLPTIPGPNNPGPNNYRIVQNFADNADTATIRTDQVFSSKQNLFERFMWYNGSQLNPGAFTTTDMPQKGRNLAVGETWVISPSLVNEIRFGYNNAYHIVRPISLDNRNWVGDIGLRNLAGGTDPIDYGRPGFTIQGFSGNGEGGITQGATENMFSISNATSWVKGSHNVRFGIGAQYRRFQHLTEVPPRGGFTFNGQFTGSPVADFLLGWCSTCTGSFGSSRSTYTSPTFAPFMDDVWNVSRDFTLQMGLRWEYLGPWAEINGIEGSFDPASGKIAYHKVPANLPAQLVPLTIATNGFYPAGIVKKDLDNFGPRVGGAYTLNDRTVIRSGFGVYYDNLNLNELQFTRLVPPFYGQYSLQPTATNLSYNADTLFPGLANIPQFPAPFSTSTNNQTAYTTQWNANVQRTFGADYVVEVAYTGSVSRHEHKRFNINQATPGTTPIETRVPYPAFQSAILFSSDAGHGNFKGVSVRLDKRYASGLFFTASYQLSKAMDNGSGEIEANDTAYATNPDADWGLSRYDQRHRAAFSYGYELPFGDGKRWLSSGGLANDLFGGWQVTGVMRFASGFPFTITSANVCQCGSYVPQRVNFAPGRGDKGKLSNPTPTLWFDPTAYVVPPLGTQGNAGRNTVIGPGTQRVDLSLSKRVPAGRTRTEVRVEVYNLLNHVNFGTPASNISNNTVGTITSADDGRNVQLGLRVSW